MDYDYVPKVTLPADFGIENLDCPVHGNIVINLQNNETMRANSMILGLHSPVFQDMFFNLGLTSVDIIDDFDPGSVRTFFRGLYCGRVGVTKENFRGLNEMISVFKVEWLAPKCKRFFHDLIRHVGDDIEDDEISREMTWILEEAMYVQKSVKNAEFLDTTVEKFLSMSDDKIRPFIEHYMSDLTSLSTDQIEIMIRIAGKNVDILMGILKGNLAGIAEGGLDKNARYLLENMDLVKCMKVASELYEEVFDILVENIDKVDGSDAKLIEQLNTNRRALRSSVVSSKESADDAHEVDSTHVESLGNQDIVNLFHDSSCLRFSHKGGANEYPSGLLHALIDVLFKSKDLKSMYMVFEALNKHGFKTALDRCALDRLVLLKAHHGFSYTHPQFLIECFHEDRYPQVLHMLLKCTDLISNVHCRRIACLRSVPVRDFFLKESYHKFRFSHPSADSSASFNCGFLLKVTPATLQNTELFNIELVRDQAECSERHVHHHADLISAENIHLVLQVDYDGYLSDTYCLSWEGKPTSHNNNTAVTWEGFCLDTDVDDDRCRVRLIAYLDL